MDTHTNRQIHTQDNYRNPCACALRVNNSLCVVLSKRWRLIIHCRYSNDGKQLISDTYVRGHISIPVTLTRNSLYLIPKHVLKSAWAYTEWVDLVPPTVAPLMDVVLVGVALFLVCISLHPLIFMYVHMLMCVCPCIHLSVGVGLHCLCLCVCKC